MARLLYRGVPYDTSSRPHPTPIPVQHTYRGHLYSAPLLHEPAPLNPNLELHYRGHAYHQGDHLAQPSPRA